MPTADPLTLLLTTDQRIEAEGLRRRYPTDADLHAKLVRLGWLTAFQARWLDRGKGDRLAVGPYLLLDRLGKGGMGQVFLARHKQTGENAALKVARTNREDNGRLKVRFAREVRAVARLDHRNVVRAIGAGYDHGALYLAMEYVTGPDLGRVLKSGKPLPPSIAAGYARQAALGLQHIHDRGLIHRDVKPSNLALAERGTVVKVLDVGLARLEEPESGDMDLTRAGRLLGSPDYVAPEQAINPTRAGPKADIYGLGCTLFHMLTGSVPFPGGSPLDKVLRHRSTEPPAMPRVPPGLVAVVHKMMAKRRRDRHGSAGEAAEALAKFASDAAPWEHTPLLVG